MVPCHLIYWLFDHVVLSVIFIVTGICCWSASYHNRWRKLNVPHTRPVPLFGNTFKMFMRLEHQMDTFDRIYKKFSGEKLCGFYQMTTPYWMIRDPELINRIMVKDFLCFTDRGSRTDPVTNVLKDSLFFQSGHRWKTMRQKLAPGFTSGRLRDAHKQINECCLQLLGCIEEKLRNDVESSIEVRQIVGKFSSDAVGSWAFGLKLNTFKNENSEFRMHAKKIFHPTIKQMLIHLLTSICPRLAKAFKLHHCQSDSSKFFHSMFSDVIKFRNENQVIKHDLTQTLLDARKELVLSPADDLDSEDKFIEADIISNAILMFVSGSGTVCATLSFCFYELALNKHVQDKLRQEITSKKAKHGGQFNQDYVMDLQYTIMVLNEIARMYSVSCTILREATTNYNVPNQSLVIEKGQKIIIPMYNIHNDPEYYPNPEVFDPERFSTEQKFKRLNGTFFPFGDGPRMCIGKRFAELEMILVLSNVLSTFKILPCEKTEIPIDIRSGSGFVSPKNGVWLNFRPLVLK